MSGPSPVFGAGRTTLQVLIAVLLLAGCDCTEAPERAMREPEVSPTAHPDDAGRLLEDVADLAVGSGHACVATAAGDVLCWGETPAAGNLVEGPSHLARPLAAALHDIVDVEAAGRRTCARSLTGDVYCWGEHFPSSEEAEVGLAGVTVLDPLKAPPSHLQAHYRLDPERVRLEGNAVHVAVAPSHSCAYLEDHSVWCWGSGMSGQLGAARRASPVRIAETAEAMRLAPFLTCVTLDDDERCCGVVSRDRVLRRDATSFGRSHMGAYIATSCGILGGRVFCMGDNSRAILGRTPEVVPFSDTPLRVGDIEDADHLGVGNDFGCVLRADRTVACWGANGDNQLGHRPSSPGDRDEIGRALAREPAPRPVPGVSQIAQLGVGAAHACVLRKDGRVGCWGSNAQGA